MPTFREDIKNNSYRTPIKMNITIASATEAVEYWLNNVVLQQEVKIKQVNFSEEDHFTVIFDRD